MLENILFAVIALGFCMIGLGVGVFFFGKQAERPACGSLPEVQHDDCPNQKAGICPVLDKTGTLKLANRARILR